ncbi:hypothetical protein GCM10027020_33390 [Nocardioides salsibiostraticola]
MELSGARMLVVGGTGVLGEGIARALLEKGASVVVTGRDAERLTDLAQDCGTSPIELNMLDVDGCADAVAQAKEALGGLTGVVVATGVAAFGAAVEADSVVAEELFAVNTLGPMAVVRAAASHLDEGGGVAVLSAILADMPTAGMAEYSASKAALTSWLTVVRRENRRKFTVLDVRPPHLDTGLSDHPLAGSAPKLPEPLAGSAVVAKVIEGLESGAAELVWDAKAKELKLI